MLRSRNNNSMTPSSSDSNEIKKPADGPRTTFSSASSSAATSSFSLSGACASMSPFAWCIIGFLVLLLFNSAAFASASFDSSSLPRMHRRESLSSALPNDVVADQQVEGMAMDAEAERPMMKYSKAGGARGHRSQAQGVVDRHEALSSKKKISKKRPMTISMRANTMAPTQNWTKVRDDLVDNVVPQLGIIIQSQEEHIAVNRISDPNDPQFYSSFQASSAHLVLNVPSDERLSKFREMITNGRFGKLVSPLTERRKLVEAPMKDLEVEIKLAEADLERIQKLSTETAKSLDEKLQLNDMLRNALRSLEYLKSQQRKITSQVEYAEVTLDVGEQFPDYVPPSQQKPHLGVSEVIFGTILLLLAVGTLYFAFFPSSAQHQRMNNKRRVGSSSNENAPFSSTSEETSVVEFLPGEDKRPVPFEERVHQ